MPVSILISNITCLFLSIKKLIRMYVGRWNHDELSNCYLSSLPRVWIRKMAGWTEHPGSFDLARARVPVPAVLAALIWPELSQYTGRFGRGRELFEELQTAGFIDLLVKLRDVVLQDSVALRKHFPNHPAWVPPVFQHPAYAQYARDVEVAMQSDTGELPMSVLLQQAIPEIGEQLRAMQQQISANQLQATQQSSLIEQHLAAISASLSTLSSGHILLQVQAPQQAGSSSSLPQTFTPSPLISNPPNASLAVVLAPNDPPSQQISEASPQTIPSYRMSRAVKTVRDLWLEWSQGINGGPSVRSLEEAHGSVWRRGQKGEHQWFSMRKKVIDAINQRVQGGISVEVTIRELDSLCERNSWTVDKLCKWVQKNGNNLPTS